MVFCFLGRPLFPVPVDACLFTPLLALGAEEEVAGPEELAELPPRRAEERVLGMLQMIGFLI